MLFKSPTSALSPEEWKRCEEKFRKEPIKITEAPEPVEIKSIVSGICVSAPVIAPVPKPIFKPAYTTILPGFSFSLPRRGYRKQIQLDTPELLTAATSKNKTSLPLLDGRSSFTETIFFADFDYLPGAFTSWDQFFTIMENYIGFDGKVERSPSGKVKVLFRALGKITYEEAKTFLKNKFSILGNLWTEKVMVKNDRGEGIAHYCLDRCETAIFNCFMNTDMIRSVKKAYPLIKQHSPITNSLSITVLKPITPKTEEELVEQYVETVNHYKKQWNFYTGTLPNKYAVGGQLEQLIRLYLGWSKKSIEGIECPINYFASMLHASTSYTSQLIQKAVKLGIVKLIKDCDRSRKNRRFNGKKWYTPAKMYALVGEVKEIATSIVKAFKTTKNIDKMALNNIPTALIDGQTHSQLFDIAKACHGNYEAFCELLEDLVGIEKKDRRSKAESIWSWLNA